jgi:hydrogenase/urease accessory protein HupE
MRRLGLACATIAWLALAAPASAHPVPFSYLDLRLLPDGIEAMLVVHVFDAAHDLNVSPPERLLDPAFLSQQSETLVALINARLHVSADERELTPEWSPAEPLPARQSVGVHIRYRTAGPPGSVTVSAILFPYDPVHQTFVNVYDGERLTQAIVDRNRSRFEYFSGTGRGIVAVAKRFVPAGIAHIVVGPEHLLFLIGLLLLGGTFRQLAYIVTAFTVAHSVTLTLAAFGVVTPPERLIEPAIALSIVYVGADNLLVRGGRDLRMWVALAFGFVHGFAFAIVLREMSLPPRALGWALFSFNLGVEIGQLLVVMVFTWALAALRSRSEAAGRQLAFAGSLVVVAAGTFWFVQRVFFRGGFQ